MPINAARRTSVCIRNHSMKRAIMRDIEDIAALIPSWTVAGASERERTMRQIDTAAGLVSGCVSGKEMRAAPILTPS